MYIVQLSMTKNRFIWNWYKDKIFEFQFSNITNYSYLQVQEWEVSSDESEKRLVPDKYIDRLGDLLDMISHL